MPKKKKKSATSAASVRSTALEPLESQPVAVTSTGGATVQVSHFQYMK